MKWLYVFLWFIAFITCWHILVTEGEPVYASIAAYFSGLFFGKLG